MNAKGTADPYLKVYLLPDASKQTKKKTTVHKGTRNPIFNEQLTWEIRTGTDLESKRLHISVWDDQTWKRNQFMGAMSFSLAEIWDPETTTTGWFKLLDEKKGEIQNIPYRPKRLADQQAAAAAATPAAPAPTPSKGCR
jgi:Ca2+-dependent lipid-binding protein